jgi:hypothetical protein
MTGQRRIGEARPRVAVNFPVAARVDRAEREATVTLGAACDSTFTLGAECGRGGYLTVGRSGLDTS